MQLLSVIVPLHHSQKQLPYITKCDTLAAQDKRISAIRKEKIGLSSQKNTRFRIVL